MFLRLSGNQYKILKADLQNGFTTGDEQYRKNIQGALTLLDKYTKSSVIQHTTSKGTSFSQSVGAMNKQLPPYDKNIGKICNASNTYRKVNHHYILQKQLPIQ